MEITSLEQPLKKERSGAQVLFPEMNESIPYSKAVALALMFYAERDVTFERRFDVFLQQYFFSSAKKQLGDFSALAGNTRYAQSPLQLSGVWIKDSVMLLYPLNTECAVRKADWLLEGLAEKRFSGGARAIETLESWVRSRTAGNPQPIIIGIAVGIIPGITLGRIKKKNPLVCIVRHDLATKRDPMLIDSVSQATLGIFTHALDLAGGNVRRLEPEVADWAYDDRTTLYYTVGSSKIIEIERDLHELDILHASVEDEQGIAVLAVSPAANSAYEELRWQLEPMVL